MTTQGEQPQDPALDPDGSSEHRLHTLVALGSLGWLALAGAASLAAGAIHATAIGAHSEHRSAVVLFTLVAVLQVGFGAAALARPGRLVLVLGAMANLALVGGWVLAKTVGLPIAGLEAAEAVQRADLLAAVLAGISVLATVAHLNAVRTTSLLRHPILIGIVAISVAALAVPAMLATGGHQHAGGHDAAAEDVVAQAYDPAMPIDLGGVEGVTPQQQAAAENLVAVTLLRLPQFADVSAVESLGFFSIHDGQNGGYEHYMSPANMKDDKMLDPDHPESLVFDTSVTPKKLVSAMFMMDEGDTLDDVPDLGGRLTQWHVHDNLCFTDGRVSDLLGPGDTCPPPSAKGAEVPMIHVWIEPHSCGPFAALDGVAAGSVAKGQVQACDAAHGAHGGH